MADPPPVLSLLVEKGPRKGQSLQRRASAVLRIGRVVKGNDLAVGDAGASQRHLDLAFLPPPASRWAATDLGSSNGTLLNDKALVPTVPAPLSDGDRIKIGERTVLAVSIAADAGPEPVSSRRTTRHSAAVVEEEEENKAPAVRRGRRKAPAAAAAVVEEEEEQENKAPVGRRGRGKALAAAVVEEEEQQENKAPAGRRGRGKDPAAAVVEEKEQQENKAPAVRRGRGKAPAAAVVVEEENKAPAAADGPEAVNGKSEIATRRGGKNKAPAVVDPPGEDKEEAAVMKRRHGRKKPVARPEAETEEEEEVLPQPQQQSARSTRAARRSEAVETGHGKVEGEQTGRGRARAARQRSRKAKEAIYEEEEEGEVAMLEEQKGTTAKSAMEKDDKAEADHVVVDGDAPLAPRENSKRAPNRRADTNSASADGDEEGKGSGMEEGGDIDQETIEKVVPESKPDSVGEPGEDGKKVVNGNVSDCPERWVLENITLREWFVRIEAYLLAKNHEAAQKAIAQVEEDHRCIEENIETLIKK